MDIVGVVEVLLGMIACWIALQSWQRKSLLYEVTSLINLLDVPKDFGSKLEVFFDSKFIDNLYLVIIKFLNSGNVPIEEKDYIRQISIDFGEKSKVLLVDVLEQKPNDLGIVPTVEDISNNKQRITITKTVLNPSDCFTVKVLATDIEKIFVNGRIVGVQRIRKINSLKTTFYALMIICTTFALTGLLFILIAEFSLYKHMGTSEISKNMSDAIKIENAGIFIIALSIIVFIWIFNRYKNISILRQK